MMMNVAVLAGMASVALGAVVNGTAPVVATPVASGTGAAGADATTTLIVTAFTTYCPAATTFVFQNKTHTATEATTLTITDCPCTLKQYTPPPVVSTIVPSNVGYGNASTTATPVVVTITPGITTELVGTTDCGKSTTPAVPAGTTTPAAAAGTTTAPAGAAGTTTAPAGAAGTTTAPAGAAGTTTAPAGSAGKTGTIVTPGAATTSPAGVVTAGASKNVGSAVFGLAAGLAAALVL